MFIRSPIILLVNRCGRELYEREKTREQTAFLLIVFDQSYKVGYSNERGKSRTQMPCFTLDCG